MGRCWLWGAGPPQTFSAQVGYLPGLSVWSFYVLPVSTRGFLHQKPQQKKHAKQQNTLRRSLTKTDGSSHLVPGRLKKSCPLLLGSLRKDSPGWEKAENKFTATSGLPACVCVCVCVCVSCVASIYARVCSSVSCVPLK